MSSYSVGDGASIPGGRYEHRLHFLITRALVNYLKTWGKPAPRMVWTTVVRYEETLCWLEFQRGRALISACNPKRHLFLQVLIVSGDARFLLMIRSKHSATAGFALCFVSELAEVQVHDTVGPVNGIRSMGNDDGRDTLQVMMKTIE